MRVVLELRPRVGDLVLPLHYNSLLQGLVYRLMADTKVADFLHDRGFVRGRRSYKMFTFSRVEGRYELVTLGGGPTGHGASHQDVSSERAQVEASDAGSVPDRLADAPVLHPSPAITAAPGNGVKRFIRFAGPVRFTISSPYEPVCRIIANNVLQAGEVRLGTQVLEVEGVRFETVSLPVPPLRLRARTPVTVYSTLMRQDGSRFTYFFEPRSGEFERLVAENLVRKFEAFWARSYRGCGVMIRWRGRAKPHIVRFRHGVIKGFTGVFEVDGDPALIGLGVEAGFGSKNAQGFGLCDPLPSPSARLNGVGGVDSAD